MFPIFTAATIKAFVSCLFDCASIHVTQHNIFLIAQQYRGDLNFYKCYKANMQLCGWKQLDAQLDQTYYVRRVLWKSHLTDSPDWEIINGDLTPYLSVQSIYAFIDCFCDTIIKRKRFGFHETYTIWL